MLAKFCFKSKTSALSDDTSLSLISKTNKVAENEMRMREGQLKSFAGTIQPNILLSPLAWRFKNLLELKLKVDLIHISLDKRTYEKRQSMF